jgi:hypothetical protein
MSSDCHRSVHTHTLLRPHCRTVWDSTCYFCLVLSVAVKRREGVGLGTNVISSESVLVELSDKIVNETFQFDSFDACGQRWEDMQCFENFDDSRRTIMKDDVVGSFNFARTRFDGSRNLVNLDAAAHHVSSPTVETSHHLSPKVWFFDVLDAKLTRVFSFGEA